MPSMNVNQPAPAFTLNDASGAAVSLDDFRERKHVLLVLKVSRSFT